MQQGTQQQRLWLIELLAWWEGRINASHLVAAFQLSREQARQDFIRYRQTYPHNLSFSSSAKAFVPTEQFSTQLISGDVVEYLNWINLQQTDLQVITSLPHTSLSLPSRHVSAQTIRVLVQAIRQQRVVDVDYVSVSNPDREGRNIVPHHFVRTGLRWHLRAYCEKTNEFRDFVLSRFRGTPELMHRSAYSAEDDPGWTTTVQLKLAPNPLLTQDKQQVVAQDYQMINQQLVLTTRACLAQYLLQEMQVFAPNPNLSPEAQQLVLTNSDEISQWLFAYHQS